MSGLRSGSAPLRIGLLGASRIAELAVTEASRETGEIRAAVAARDPERARAYAAEHGYDGIGDDYEALVADDSLDLIYIGLPNGLHAEWTARALAQGRNVLVEKPFAANLAEFDAVAERMEQAQGWAWEAFHYADHPAVRRLIEIASSGEIGELRGIDVRMDMPAPPASDPRWAFELAGGTMMDLGCYALNALLLLGEAVEAPLALRSAEADPYEGDARVDATVRARLLLGDIPVTMHTSMVSEGWDFGIRIEGSLGSARFTNFVKPQEGGRLIVRVGDPVSNVDDPQDGSAGPADAGSGAAAEREEPVGDVSSYTYQLQRVREAVRSGERSPQLLARSRRTMALIDEIYGACGLPPRPGRLS